MLNTTRIFYIRFLWPRIWLLFGRFSVCTRNVKRAVRTYAELKIAVAGATNEVIIGTWVTLETAAQSVGELYEILNAIIYEISFD